jgi:hypothetical protein
MTSWLKGLTKETDIRVAKFATQRRRYMLSDKNIFRGKAKTAEHRLKISLATKGKPKTATPTYRALHGRLVAKQGKPKKCENIDCLHKSQYFEYALRHGHVYSDNIADYIALCRQCHSKYDNQVGKGWITRKNNILKNKKHGTN